MGVSLASSGKQLPESFYSYGDLNDEKHVEVNAFFVFVAHYLYLVYDNTSPFRGGGGGGSPYEIDGHLQKNKKLIK